MKKLSRNMLKYKMSGLSPYRVLVVKLRLPVRKIKLSRAKYVINQCNLFQSDATLM